MRVRQRPPAPRRGASGAWWVRRVRGGCVVVCWSTSGAYGASGRSDAVLSYIRRRRGTSKVCWVLCPTSGLWHVVIADGGVFAGGA